MSIIEKLLTEERFDLHPILKKDPKYKEVGKKITDYMDKCQAKMSKEDFTDLEDLYLDIREQGAIESEYHFVHGFKLATLLLFEVFADDWGLINND